MTDLDADEELAPLRDRLAAMRRTLAEAYRRRDALATEASVIVAARGSVPSNLLIALSAVVVRGIFADPTLRDGILAGFRRGFGLRNAVLSKVPQPIPHHVIARALNDAAAERRAANDEPAYLGFTCAATLTELEGVLDGDEQDRVGAMKARLASLIELVGPEVLQGSYRTLKDSSKH